MKRPEEQSYTTLVVVAVLALPLLYGLSIGPYAMLFGEPEGWAGPFYAPLKWVLHNVPFAKEVIRW